MCVDLAGTYSLVFDFNIASPFLRHRHAATVAPMTHRRVWCTGADSMERGTRAPTFTNTGHGGHREYNSKQETDQTVLTISKALTKTTHCTFLEPKKVEGHDQKIVFFRASFAPPLSNSSRRHWSDGYLGLEVL